MVANELKLIIEKANDELPKRYKEAQEADLGYGKFWEPTDIPGHYIRNHQVEQDYTLWNKLKKSEEELVGKARKILKQTLFDFKRRSESDGSWKDSVYGCFFEHNPRRLVETYSKDTLEITLEYDLPKTKLTARDTKTEVEINVWETLDKLIKERGDKK